MQTTTVGNIVIDRSEKACQEFGFAAGERIITPSGEKATVIGVGKPAFGTGKVLWYNRDSKGPGWWTLAPYESQNLRDHGFTQV